MGTNVNKVAWGKVPKSVAARFNLSELLTSARALDRLRSSEVRDG